MAAKGEGWALPFICYAQGTVGLLPPLLLRLLGYGKPLPLLFIQQAKKHYVCVPAETTPEQVSQFMSKYWGLRNPKIVLSVISDIEHYKPWKNQRLKDDFEKGIIKVN